MSTFAPLGKSHVYELAELPSEILKKLTPNSTVVVGGARKRLRDITCEELDEAVAYLKRKRRRKPPGPLLHHQLQGHIAAIGNLFARRPGLQAEARDDLLRLVAHRIPPTPRPERGLTAPPAPRG